MYKNIANEYMLDFNVYMSESLASYVARILSEKRLSGNDVARACNFAITQSHINRISNGEVLNPSTAKLKALAKGLGVPEHELFAVARGIDPTKADLSHERLASIDAIYPLLPKTSKAKVDYLIETIEREVVRLRSEVRPIDAKHVQNVNETFATATSGRVNIPQLREPAK